MIHFTDNNRNCVKEMKMSFRKPKIEIEIKISFFCKNHFPAVSNSSFAIWHWIACYKNGKTMDFFILFAYSSRQLFLSFSNWSAFFNRNVSAKWNSMKRHRFSIDGKFWSDWGKVILNVKFWCNFVFLFSFFPLDLRSLNHGFPNFPRVPNNNGFPAPSNIYFISNSYQKMVEVQNKVQQ